MQACRISVNLIEKALFSCADTNGLPTTNVDMPGAWQRAATGASLAEGCMIGDFFGMHWLDRCEVDMVCYKNKMSVEAD